jgi:hypothetical protein
MDRQTIAVFIRLHLAHRVLQVRALVRFDRETIHLCLHLTDLLHSLDLVLPLHELGPLDVGDGVAVDAHHGNVHLLRHKLALLPRKGLTTGLLLDLLTILNHPNLFTYFLRFDFAFRDLLRVLLIEGLLIAGPVREVLVADHTLLPRQPSEHSLAFGPSYDVASHFRHLATNLFILFVALFLEKRLTALSFIRFKPDKVPYSLLCAYAAVVMASKTINKGGR